MTILVIRYLYFGRPQLVPRAQHDKSPMEARTTGVIPSSMQDSRLGANSQSVEDMQVNEWTNESAGPENLSDYLTAGLLLEGSVSRSPSPLLSPQYHSEPPNTNMWDSRYDVHNEAFESLVANLLELQNEPQHVFLRYFLVPVVVLSLVSRPDSKERALCQGFFENFKNFMEANSESPIRGDKLEIGIPWEKLDAYSAMSEQERDSHLASGSCPDMPHSASEWNWWDMLKHTDMNLSCKWVFAMFVQLATFHQLECSILAATI